MARRRCIRRWELNGASLMQTRELISTSGRRQLRDLVRTFARLPLALLLQISSEEDPNEIKCDIKSRNVNFS
jgi:hypothetical protein